jgi:hypothetical protein
VKRWLCLYSWPFGKAAVNRSHPPATTLQVLDDFLAVCIQMRVLARQIGCQACFHAPSGKLAWFGSAVVPCAAGFFRTALHCTGHVASGDGNAHDLCRAAVYCPDLLRYTKCGGAVGALPSLLLCLECTGGQPATLVSGVRKEGLHSSTDI